MHKLKLIIADTLGLDIDSITDTATFSQLHADSLDMVRIIMAVEDEYNIKIPDTDLDKISTVASIQSYIEAKQ